MKKIFVMILANKKNAYNKISKFWITIEILKNWQIINYRA